MTDLNYNRIQLLLATLDAKDTKTITNENGQLVIIQDDAIQGESREQLKRDLLDELKVTNKDKPIIHKLS